MKGTEKIIAHIQADGDAEAKRITDEASAEAESIRAEKSYCKTSVCKQKFHLFVLLFIPKYHSILYLLQGA